MSGQHEIPGAGECVCVCVCVCVRARSQTAHKHTVPGTHSLRETHTVRSELVHVKQPLRDKQETVFKNQVEYKVR